MGTGFALAYKLSGNNLLAAYLVNMPNAFMIYLLKREQLAAQHTPTSNITAAASIILIVVIFVIYRLKVKNNPPLIDGL